MGRDLVMATMTVVGLLAIAALSVASPLRDMHNILQHGELGESAGLNDAEGAEIAAMRDMFHQMEEASKRETKDTKFMSHVVDHISGDLSNWEKKGDSGHLMEDFAQIATHVPTNTKKTPLPEVDLDLMHTGRADRVTKDEKQLVNLEKEFKPEAEKMEGKFPGLTKAVNKFDKDVTSSEKSLKDAAEQTKGVATMIHEYAPYIQWTDRSQKHLSQPVRSANNVVDQIKKDFKNIGDKLSDVDKKN